MPPQSCDKTPPGRHEWARNRALILSLYEHRTCQQVSDYMKEHHDFYATPRMYKDRLKEWRATSKKIPFGLYYSMWIILQVARLEGHDIQFKVPGPKKRVIKPKAIRKELTRHKTKRTPPLLTFAEATNTICREGFEVLTCTPLGNRAIMDVAALRKYAKPKSTVKQESGPRSPLHPNLEFEHALSSALAVQSAIDCNLDHDNSCLTHLANGRTHQSQHRLYDSEHVDHSTNVVSRGRGEMPRCFKIAGACMLTQCCGAWPPLEEVDAFDFSREITTLWTPDKLPVPEDVQKRITVEWVGPFFARCCILNASLPPKIVLLKQANSKLGSLLNAGLGNPYLLPCLNWVNVMMTSSGECRQLLDFLNESCVVLHNLQLQSTPVAVAFFYLRACCCASAATAVLDHEVRAHENVLHWEQQRRAASIEIRQWGEQIEPAVSELRHHLGDSHPNVLIMQSYQAFHCGVHQGRLGLCTDLLNSCMDRLQRVGRSDFMAVNCKALLGSIYTSAGRLEEARELLLESVGDLRNAVPVTESWRLSIVRRLADIEAQLGFNKLAEDHYKEVLTGRIAVFSLDNWQVWGVINKLEEFYVHTDQFEKCQEHVDHYDRLWDQFIREKGQHRERSPQFFSLDIDW